MARPALDDAAWNSPWRTRSTLEKAVLSLGLLLVAVTSPTTAVSGLVLLVSVLIALVGARIPPRGYALALLGPATFVLIGAVVIAVLVGRPPAEAIWSWWLLSATDDSLALAAQVTTRSVASFSAVLLLAATTPMSDLLAGLRALRVPEVLVEIAGLMYRMLFSLLSSAGAIMEAQRARLGYASASSARRSVGGVGGAVLRQAWTRAQRLEAGLEGRGYTGSLRTLTPPRPVSRRFLVLSGLLLVTLMSISITTAVLR
ncbi:cobalt ECF transporter T component CbiQ [Enemella sp. A6]|uniref:cobalt ECF transporter T component CbiQ n=1 Tax=Enemella sp. A6 TaxID=3440152 RepID=UPI003EC14630